MHALNEKVAERVRQTNASRAQYLGCAFALTYLVGGIGDAAAMGTLANHGFMLGQLAFSIAVACVVRWTAVGRRHAGVVFATGMSLVSACGAAHLARLGGLDGPYFYGSYTAAPILIPLLLPLAARIAGTIVTVGAFVVVYLFVRPDLFAHPMAHIPIVYLLTIGAISVALGHYVRRLELGSFVDVARLEAAAAMLEAQLRTADVEHADSTQLRKQIARQLHDDVAQLITGARLHLDGWAQRRPKDDVSARLQELLDELARRSQRMLQELREPPARGALADELLRLRAEYVGLGLTLDVLLDDDTKRAHHSIGHVEVLVATVREALTNAVRHGSATEATVSVYIDGPSVMLEVWDNGGGRVAALREGYGLLGIRERVEALAGGLTISDYDCGLRLSVALPRTVPA